MTHSWTEQIKKFQLVQKKPPFANVAKWLRVNAFYFRAGSSSVELLRFSSLLKFISWHFLFKLKRKKR